MAETILNKRRTLTKRVDVFLNIWHQFPIDYWWRKKYNVPFGSPQHRNMNFIDMLIEYREEENLNKLVFEGERENEEIENEALGLIGNDEEVVRVTQSEIDEDFENLDLEQFDKI